MKRVPMLMPSAPSASAATRPRPSPKPPEAIIGILILSAAAGIKISPGVSSSPGWPAHSRPSVEIASAPVRSADRPRRTAGAFVDDLDAVLLDFGDVVLRLVARGFHDLDAGLDDGLAVF